VSDTKRERKKQRPFVTPNEAGFGVYSFASIMLRLQAKHPRLNNRIKAIADIPIAR